jgi:hypothetical protein
MPRGFKVNRWATRQARFSDSRSFVSISKAIPGECDKPKPHVLLYGKDKTMMRDRIFQRNRDANNGLYRCDGCTNQVAKDEYPSWTPPGHNGLGEWHHVRHRAGERCDCMANATILCRLCHRPRHPQTQFREGVRRIAKEIS